MDKIREGHAAGAAVGRKDRTGGASHRDPSVDVLKGILVLQMVLCHCIQFFGKDSAPVQRQICDYINLTTFSGFLFAFGFGCQYAYFSKSFRTAALRMARTAAKCLLAFYLSSICYIAFVEYDYYDPRVFRQVFLLQKYAGWSEFLASFFGVMLLALVLFFVFQRMNGYLLAGVGGFSLALTFLPYDRIHHPWAALFIGSTDYTTFPVLQYLFYFAAGVYLCRRKGGKGWIPAAVAVLLSLPEVWCYGTTGYLSMRFPPDWRYVFGASAVVYFYYLISRRLCAEQKSVRAVAALRNVLSQLGKNAVFYLLFSNLLIFSFAGSNFKMKKISFAVEFYVLLMLAAWFCQHLIKGERALKPAAAASESGERMSADGK